MAASTLGPPGRAQRLTTALFVGAVVWAAFGYLLLLALYLPELLHSLRSDSCPTPPPWRRLLQSVLWTAAGASAIFAVMLPILADLTRLRARRIWAMARLSFKEAVRRKVLWVFLALLLVVLFGSWFIQDKPEDQVRTYVQVVFGAMTSCMLILAGSSPASASPTTSAIRRSTPSSPSRCSASRSSSAAFLGYAVLMTAALLVVSGFALLYVLRDINRDAPHESLKAREPLLRHLTFQGTKDKDKGENVGREWEYRTYIVGKPRNADRSDAVRRLELRRGADGAADSPHTRLEFALDIYRTHKGVEGQGIFCTFFVESWCFRRRQPGDDAGVQRPQEGAGGAGASRTWPASSAEEFGYYEYPAMEVKDYHTQSIEVPAGVFANAARPATDADKDRQEELRRRREWPAAAAAGPRPRRSAAAQFVGMAKRDLYFRLDQDDASGAANKARFAVNFFKGELRPVAAAVPADRPGGGGQHLPQRRHHPADDGGPLRPRLLPGLHQGGAPATTTSAAGRWSR